VGDPLRHQPRDQSAFGNDKFGKLAESFARFFGTPKFIITQTCCVAGWLIAGGLVGFDAYPYIALNLLFSTQAAYAAPLILLAQTRQSDRDKALAEADARHREEIADQHRKMLQQNTELTERVEALAKETHELLAAKPRTRRKPS